MWASLIAGIVKLFGLIASYINNKQLLDAGKASQQADDAKATQKAKDELHDIQNTLAADADKRKQLRDKWTDKN
jgi:hypothetical protein